MQHQIELLPDYYNTSCALTEYDFYNEIAVHNQELILQHELVNVVEQLSNTQPFFNFNLYLHDTDIANLNKLRITEPGQYLSFGGLEKYNDDAYEFINSLSPENAEVSADIASLLTKIVKDISITQHYDDSFFVIMRGSTINNDGINKEAFGWHRDFCYSKPNCTDHDRGFVFTLKGPSTLFYNGIVDENNNDILDLLKTSIVPIDLKRVISASFGQGTVFKMDLQVGAVHAVPVISEERLFIHVIQGNKESIKEFHEDVKTRLNKKAFT